MQTVNADAIEHLAKAARGRLSAAAREQIQKLGIALDGPYQATYPVEAWAACVKLIAADLFPGIDEIEAQRQLAHLRIGVVSSSLRGRALFALSRLAGRERGLARFVQALASGATHQSPPDQVAVRDVLQSGMVTSDSQIS